MKFFKRRRKENQEQINERDLNNFDLWFQDRLDAAAATVGADEKLLKLAEIRTDIDAKIMEKRTDITSAANKKGGMTAAGSLVTQVGVVAGVGILSGGLLLPALLVVPTLGMLGTEIVSTKVKTKTKKRLERQASDLMGALETGKATVLEIENKLMEENIETIAKSSIREKIFAHFPDIKSRFAEVAARRVIEGKPEAPKKKSLFDRIPGR